MCEKWYIIVLVFIPLLMGKVEHIFKCVLAPQYIYFLKLHLLFNIIYKLFIISTT